jgi:hypothetical protein
MSLRTAGMVLLKLILRMFRGRDARAPDALKKIETTIDYDNERFRIHGGDGDQDLFGEPLILRRTFAPWFGGTIGQHFGEAWLVEVVEGKKRGLMLGLTPRTLGEISDDIAEHGWKSVVVHGIDFPGHDPERHGRRSLIGGMTVLERLPVSRRT